MTAYSEQLVNDLEDKAKLFRREILEMTFQAESGHPGGFLSAIDIITVLYYYVMRVNRARVKQYTKLLIFQR